jgi:quinoprotein glucose dehydrogenase
MSHSKFFLLLFAGCLIASTARGQYGAPGQNWPHYAGDQGATKYSSLSQIDARNFGKLEVLWRWTSPDEKLLNDVSLNPYQFRATPIVVDGVAYVSTALSQVSAIDIHTGETFWTHDPESYKRGMVTHGLAQHRGVEYWTDGTEERIIMATGGRQLLSLDAKTGTPDPKFADGGWVDTLKDLGRPVSGRNIGHNKPTVVIKDTIVLGSIIMDFPSLQTNPPGHIRGYDVRTGAQKWIFHTIPQKGEFGNESWENDAWKYAGNTNAWSLMTADPEFGYLYLPIGAPTSDYYGGHRPGDNLFSQSLLCLDASTGERVWHFQAVHHGIWDYDFPCAPNLIDIVVDGKKIQAVAAVTKQGFTYVFDRVTGEPVWPIEERQVNIQSSVPGERLSPTQPFPTKPPPFERQGLTEDDLIDFTPELKKEALEIAEDYVLGPLFTPNIVTSEKKQGLLQLPGTVGGANWPGASVDPETGMLYVQSQTRPSVIGLIEPDSNRSNLKYVLNGAMKGDGNDDMSSSNMGPRGLPLIKPPYRRITALNLNKGEIQWQIPFGDGPRNHPAIKHLDLGPLGSRFPSTVLAEGGILVTKTLIITLLADVDELGDRLARGSWLVALDKKTGEEIGRIKVDRHLHSSPMTAMHNGRQYILIAGGGRDEPGELLAFGLPE